MFPLCFKIFVIRGSGELKSLVCGFGVGMNSGHFLPNPDSLPYELVELAFRGLSWGPCARASSPGITAWGWGLGLQV